MCVCRYGWVPARLPASFVCGTEFTICHALSCPYGGFPSIRHNEIRDVTTAMSRQVAHNASLEPSLQPLSGERFQHRSATTDYHARLDIGVTGLWGSRFERTLIDARVINRHALSNRAAPLSIVYRNHEKEKKRHYGERVRNVQQASFVPAVMSASRGFSRAAALYKRISILHSEKQSEPYSHAMAFIRCRISFALLHSCTACLRGSRVRHRAAANEVSHTLAVSEAHILRD